jgi:putative transposase
MVILTYKIKHGRTLKDELAKARLVAEYAIKNRDKLSTKNVKQMGLKSVIANQILRKYGLNKKCKSIKSINLIVPHQGIRFDNKLIKISSLKLEMSFDKQVSKINQIELDDTYAYVSCSVEEPPKIEVKTHMGVDRNTTGNIATVAIRETGKVWKFGKRALHVRKKYHDIRKRLQRKKRYREVKRVKNREQRIVKDINHKISRAIIDLAKANASEIRLENLKGIRKAKSHKSFKYTLNSWSFYQLQTFIEYKALLAGVKVFYIDPAYTSKSCSICGSIGERNGKSFKCYSCGHVEHADVNASFNIAFPSRSILQLQAERDVCKGRSDTPKRQRNTGLATLESNAL